MLIVNCKQQNAPIIERDDITKMFFNEVKKYPVLTAEEEYELICIVKGGSPKRSEEAREKLINCNQRFIISAAKKYVRSGNFLDIVNEGNVGLMKAIDNYDISKKQRFLTYAVYWIRKFITEYVVYQERSVRPHNANKVHTYASKAWNILFQKLERVPTPEEIRDYVENDFGVAIPKAEDFNNFNMCSIDISASETQNYTESYSTVYDFNAATSNNNVADNIDNESSSELAYALISTLSERAQQVMRMYFGIGIEYSLTTDEIAERMGVCTERIRQIIKESIKKMKADVKNKNFDTTQWQ